MTPLDGARRSRDNMRPLFVLHDNGLRQLARDLLRSRGVLDLADVERLRQRAEQDGVLSDAERTTLRQLASELPTTPDARQAMTDLADGVSDAQRQALLGALNARIPDWGKVPESYRNSRRFVFDAAVRSLRDISGLPPQWREDEAFVGMILRARPEFRLSGSASNSADRFEIRTSGLMRQAIEAQDGSVLRLGTDELKNDRSLALLAVASDPHALEHVSKRLQADRSLVTTAVEGSASALRHASDELKDDPDVVRAAVRKDGSALRWAGAQARKDRELVVLALRTRPDAFAYADESLRDCHAIFDLVADTHPWLIGNAGQTLRDDRRVIENVVSERGRLLAYASARLRDDEALVATAIGRDVRAYEHASKRLQAHDPFVRKALRQRGSLFYRAPRSVRATPEYYLLALEAGAKAALQYASAAIQADRALVLASVKRQGTSLQWAAESLRADVKLSRAALQSNPEALAYVDEALRDNRELVRLVISKQGELLRHASPRLRDDRELGSEAIRDNPRAWSHLSARLQHDRNMALVTVRAIALQGARARSYTPDLPRALLADRAFMNEALRIVPDLLKTAPEAIRGDAELLGPVIVRHPTAWFHAATVLKDDEAFVRMLLKQNGSVYEKLPETYKTRRDLLQIALRSDPAVLQAAPAKLRGDRALVRESVRRGAAPPVEALADPALFKEVVQMHPDALRVAVRGSAFQSATLSPKDREDVAVLACARNPKQLVFARNLLFPTRKADAGSATEARWLAFIVRAARKNPMVLAELSGADRGKVFALVPQLQRPFEQLTKQLFDLSIFFPERFANAEVRNEVIANRLEPRPPGDERPLAVVVMPVKDHNSAFAINEMDALIRGYRVLYYEARTDAELARCLQEAANSNGKADLLIVGGHGTRNRLALGGEDPANEDDVERNDAAYLDPTDADVVGAALRDCVACGAHVVLHSCSTGYGFHRVDNLADFVARMAPQAYVYAPAVPTNAHMHLDEAGLFVDAGFWCGPGNTYVIAPTARA